MLWAVVNSVCEYTVDKNYDFAKPDEKRGMGHEEEGSEGSSCFLWTVSMKCANYDPFMLIRMFTLGLN